MRLSVAADNNRFFVSRNDFFPPHDSAESDEAQLIEAKQTETVIRVEENPPPYQRHEASRETRDETFARIAPIIS